MLKQIRFLLITSFCLIYSIRYSNAQPPEGLPFITYYSSEDYQAGIQNWSIVQNRYGLLYAANNFGLLEYDGTQWKLYSSPAGTKVRDVFISSSGNILQAMQGDFGYFESESMRWVSLADSLSDTLRNLDEVWEVFELSTRYYFCTNKHIFMFNMDGSYQTISPGFEMDDFNFANNKLYINVQGSGLHYLEENRLIKFLNADFFGDKTITNILPLSNNHLMISTLENGIYAYDGSTFELWESEMQPMFMESQANCILRLSNGDFAVGTQNDGVIILKSNGQLIRHLTKGQGLDDRTVITMHEDMQGNLWLGHNNGISKVELNQPFTLINEQQGLPGTGYDGILHEGKLYLATNNGLFISEQNPVSYKLVPGTEGQVYTLKKINDKLLIGHSQGVFELIDEQPELIMDLQGVWTFLELPLHPDYILMGTYNGLALLNNKNSNLSFERWIKGFEESSRVMEVDESGNVWMTHGYKGVYRLNLNDELDEVSVRYYGPESGLPGKNHINVWRTRNQLVFTTDAGVYRYDEAMDRFVPDEYFKDYLNREIPVSYLEETVLGHIFYLSDLEIGVLHQLPNRTHHKESKVFNRIQGILNDDLVNLSVLDNDNVLYGAKSGFVLFSSSKARLSELPYSTLLREITFGQSSDSLTNIRGTSSVQESPPLSFNQNSVRFEYSSPYFIGNEKNLYQYKLDNHDEDWSDWSLETIKEYTNLREGDYTFHVRAQNIYDQISEEATYSFTVLPPWYRTRLAYLGYLICFFAMMSFLFVILDRRHRKEKEMMVIQQERKLFEKDLAIKSSAQELQTLKNEKLESEVELKNKQLATSTMHLLNKNSFINSMKQSIKSTEAKSKNQEVSKELHKLVLEIDRNMSDDEDWDQFAIHFDQVHGDFTHRIQLDFPNLSPQDIKLSAYLRLNLTTKEIAHLLNISVRGVEIARYRLRKKLELERKMNLQEYILKY